MFEFFSSPVFIIIGGFSTIVLIGGLFYTVYLTLKGILPVLYRLGIGISNRKIAIFAEDRFNELNNVLVDSKVFNEKNIIKIEKNEIKKSDDISILLVHWNSFKDNIDKILKEKKHSDGLIIYAPQEEGFIDKEDIKKLNLESNCIIVNFRGRLLNDILVSMITTSYEKR